MYVCKCSLIIPKTILLIINSFAALYIPLLSLLYCLKLLIIITLIILILCGLQQAEFLYVILTALLHILLYIEHNIASSHSSGRYSHVELLNQYLTISATISSLDRLLITF